MYHLIVNGFVKYKCKDKGEVSGHIAELTPDHNYSVMTDCTDEFPTPHDHRLAEQRNVTLDAIGKRIDFSKFDFQMSSEMQRDAERWEKLMDEQNQFEIKCGY